MPQEPTISKSNAFAPASAPAAAAPAPAPSAKVRPIQTKTAVKAPPRAITPFTFRETRLRDGMIAALKEWKPEGNPDLVQLENVRSFALAEVSGLPDEFNAVEVMVEARATPGARQANVIVFPKKL